VIFYKADEALGGLIENHAPCSPSLVRLFNREDAALNDDFDQAGENFISLKRGYSEQSVVTQALNWLQRGEAAFATLQPQLQMARAHAVALHAARSRQRVAAAAKRRAESVRQHAAVAAREAVLVSAQSAARRIFTLIVTRRGDPLERMLVSSEQRQARQHHFAKGWLSFCLDAQLRPHATVRVVPASRTAEASAFQVKPNTVRVLVDLYINHATNGTLASINLYRQHRGWRWRIPTSQWRGMVGPQHWCPELLHR
jgi:hypothetical protein